MTEPMDPQAAAFRTATEADWVDDERMQAMLATGELIYWAPDDRTPIRTPEQWEAEGWDADRAPAKTLAQAREALAARIADPSAPDTAAEANAYHDDAGGA
ncbi:MAG: hypothetical protein ABR608_14420 [Pseudonocardiaceae bacterium]